MASGASVNATLEDAINDPFFGEREAIALSYGENGSPTNEQIAPHYSMADAQPITLEPLVVPDTDLEGVNADKVFDVTAADVVGYLGRDKRSIEHRLLLVHRPGRHPDQLPAHVGRPHAIRGACRHRSD